MSKQIRWSVTANYIQTESQLIDKTKKLILSIVELEQKMSLLTNNQEITEQLNDVLDTQEKLLKEFLDNCYKITPRTEIILGNIPLMN